MKYSKNTLLMGVMMIAALLAGIGCDEALNMTKEVIDEPSADSGKVAEPVVPADEVKQPTEPEEEMNPEEEPDPVEVIPEEDPPVQEPVSMLLTPEPEYGITHHYTDGVARTDILPRSAWVLNFPGPYVRYTPPASDPEDFAGRVCMPVGRGIDYDNWAAEDHIAPVSKAIVTITDGPRAGEQMLTDKGGYYHFKNVTDDELYLRVERQWLEPKEVIVYRDRPTMLQEIGPNRVFSESYYNRDTPSNAPGTILMGIRWSDSVRFVLENETLPYDLLCILAFRPQEGWRTGGTYGEMRATVYNIHPRRSGEFFFAVLLHELAHARQHAIALLHGGEHTRDWENTPEAQAYRAAWEKDVVGVPSKDRMRIDKSDYYKDDLLENAAELYSMYWQFEIGGDPAYEESRDDSILRAKASNRFKWCQKYLNRQHD